MSPTTRTRRAKLIAGIGVLTMLLGALLALAPTVGAHHEEGALTPTIHQTNVLCGDGGSEESPVIGLGYDDFVGFSTNTEPPVDGVDFDTSIFEGVLHFHWTSSIHDVEAIVVKQAAGSAVFSNLPSPTSGTVYVATGTDRTTFSHIDFCFNDQPDVPELRVEKVVSGTAPSGAVFEIDVAKDGQESLVADDEQIAPDAPYTTSGAGTYDIDEVTTGGAAVSWACFVGGSATASASGAGASIADVVVDQQNVRCVFTNTFSTPPPPVIVDEEPIVEPEVASLQIIKAVTGDVPDDWSFDFDGDLGDFVLTDVAPSNTVADLEADASYTVVEAAHDRAELVSIDCDEGATFSVDETLGSVTVTLAEGEFVSCTFTNDFPEVEPSEVTRPTAPPTTEPEPEPEVLPEVVTRPTTLPRTGDETRHLAGLGATLLVFGAVLVAASRRDLVRTG